MIFWKCFFFPIAVVLTCFFLAWSPLNAHCDTMDGPVVADAKAALAKGDVTPVLKWVKKEAEGEIRQAFQKTLAVRGKGPEAMELADTYFFETLVRVHRAGEGAPYTGLQPAGAPLDPIVQAADRALDSGSVDDLSKAIASHAEGEIRKRFARVMEAKKLVNESGDAGRAYVEAYVDYVHYIENLHQAVVEGGAHVH